jgi:hypothetical protein
MVRKIAQSRHLNKGNTKLTPLFLVVAFLRLIPGVHFFGFVMVSLSSFVGSFSCVAFSGSRVVGSSAAVSAHAFLSAAAVSVPVGVGCASGVDSLVRLALPSASVFSVSSFLVGGRVCRASFARRSAALVSWCASSRGLLVAFPLGVCPPSVRPSSSFSGCGSGSWGSVALALGLGCSVLVVLSAGSSVASFGSLAPHFQRVGVAPCGGSLWLSVSAPLQLPLF